VPTTLWTLGHSNVSLEEFLELVRSFDLRALADVRSFPASRRYPHFAREALTKTLAAEHIDYRWFPGLGGRRKPRSDSQHHAWRVEGFRAYADYMQTPEFEQAFTEFLEWADDRRTGFFCAERLWWECHRRVLSDRLVTRGIAVRHITAPRKDAPHVLTEFARLDGDRLIYDRDLFEEKKKTAGS
jgi:uncharacterized protein (DUF488 family)